ncbi:DUF1285 domain-containing protein [Glaciecola siphonariae]|uniref:DUF1285 domain-containing protein n=1 Tax=Glaciecola siphonariae TaxID=521012 RepID=A0ABV9LQA9_9ALTE
MDLFSLQQQLSAGMKGTPEDSESNSPPVDRWNPAFCGDMNLVIKRSGQWWHEGTPFTRAPLVKLFASVIKKEDEKYFLVTPVEKIGITVEDVPFVIIDHSEQDNVIHVTTSVGERFTINQDHPVELREFDGHPVPYCKVRRNLWARVHQNVLYRWVEQAQQIQHNGKLSLYLQSGDYRFSIGSIDAAE